MAIRDAGDRPAGSTYAPVRLAPPDGPPEPVFQPGWPRLDVIVTELRV